MIEALRVHAPDGAVTGARRAGTAGPALIFVHGVGSTAAIWDRQLETFGARYRCAAVELRGNGALQPDPVPASITRAGFADDVLAVADACDFDRFTLVGCSLGGVVAFELWTRAPQRLKAMSLVGSFAHYPDARVYADGVKAAVRAAGTMDAFARARAAKLGLPPARLQETIEQMACKSVPCYLAATEATWTGDYRGLLPAIDVPAQVLHGERDTVAPRELSEEIARGIPGATLTTVEDAGHVANADNPDRFDALLNEFLQRS
ncbi:MAG TPA: alpha/beta fold hydrolase [Candidatus Tumulicola sp.]|nr:alpha/beta fold hydrolase [Candidatus Tumulicola sp.]